MASAAFMLGSQTDEIQAVNLLSMFGSVGVATSRLNVDFIRDIANTDSPKKRPDVATEEGISVIREELDDIFAVLAEKIAEGRGVSVDVVRKKYGEGGMMTARTALERNMIDGIIEQQQSAAKSAVAKREKDMNLDDLKENHASVYREALKEATIRERERVMAHLKLAKSSGDFETAHKHIAEGVSTGESVMAHHAAARMERQEIEARQHEAAPDVDVASETTVTDPRLAMKSEIEAKCPGLEWEVM